jgi:hypothetical protein
MTTSESKMNKTSKEKVKRMMEWVSGKLEYTEEEAASALGVSIGQLRSLVKTHVINEESGPDVPISTFRPTDLLLLKMLSESPSGAVTTLDGN